MANSLDLRIFDDKEIVPNGRLEDLITAAIKLLDSRALAERLVCCFVFFGITDLLDVKQSPNYREVVLRESGDALLLSKIDWAARTLKDKGVLPVFCTFPPISFSKHNQFLVKNGLTNSLRFDREYPTMQSKLNEIVAKVNTRIEEVNCGNGVITCQLSAKVFSCEKSKYVLREAYLKDGLHLTNQGATLLNLELAQNLRKAKQGKRSPDWLKKSHQVKSASAISFSIKKKEDEKSAASSSVPKPEASIGQKHKEECKRQDPHIPSSRSRRSRSPQDHVTRRSRSRSRSRDRRRARSRSTSQTRTSRHSASGRFEDLLKPSLLGDKPKSLLGLAPDSSPDKFPGRTSNLNTLSALARMPNVIAQNHAQQLQQQLAQQLKSALGDNEARKLMETIEQRFGKPNLQTQGGGFNQLHAQGGMQMPNPAGDYGRFGGPMGENSMGNFMSNHAQGGGPSGAGMMGAGLTAIGGGVMGSGGGMMGGVGGGMMGASGGMMGGGGGMMGGGGGMSGKGGMMGSGGDAMGGQMTGSMYNANPMNNFFNGNTGQGSNWPRQNSYGGR